MFETDDISNTAIANAAISTIPTTTTTTTASYDCQLIAKTLTDYHTLDNGSSYDVDDND